MQLTIFLGNYYIVIIKDIIKKINAQNNYIYTIIIVGLLQPKLRNRKKNFTVKNSNA